MKTDEVLYIAELDYDITKSGGAMGEAQHLKMLKRLFTVEEARVFSKGRTKLSLLLALAFSPIPVAFSFGEVLRLKRMIKRGKHKIVVIENSNLGYLARYAKRQGKKVITFFHNCEYMFAKACRNKIWLPSVTRNESYALRFSDVCFVLSPRDKNDLLSIYPCSSDNLFVLPSFSEDALNSEEIRELAQRRGNNIFLFIGSFFKPNVDAVRYINEEIAPSCPDAIFKVCGFRMEDLVLDWAPNVVNLGTVSNLKELMLESGSVLFPIFEGSGMKTKTLDSLMYGKYIIGSEEAFSGFKISQDCVVCSTKSDYVKAVRNALDRKRMFSETNRENWESLYSSQSAKAALLAALKTKGIYNENEE